MNSFLRACAQFIDGRSRTVWLFLLVLSGAAGFGLTKFEIDPDVSALLPADSPEVELFKAANLDEESSRTLYLLLSGSDLEQRLGECIDSLRASPYLGEVHATRAEFGGDFAERAQRAPLWYLPEEGLTGLEQRLTGPGRAKAVAETKELLQSDPLMGQEVVKSDPLGLRWVLSQAAQASMPAAFATDSPYLLLKDGGGAFLRVRGHETPFNVDFSRRLLADVEERTAGFDLVAVGGYAIARKDAARIRGDLESSIHWSVPLLLVFFLLSTRSLLVPHLYLLPTGLALLWTLGFGGLLLGPMTPLAVSSAAILCGLGVDFSIHYLGRFREERSRGDASSALLATHAATGRSLIGCWLTSSVAFLAFAFGSFAGLRSLGLLLALGLTLSLLSTWTLLPLLLRSFGSLPAKTRPSPVLSMFGRLAKSKVAGPTSLAILLLAGLGWTSVLRGGVAIDADPSRLRPADSELLRSLDALERSLGFAPEGITLAVDREAGADALISASESLLDGGQIAHSNANELIPYSSRRKERVAAFRSKTEDWLAGALSDFQAAGFRPQALAPGLENFEELFSADPPPEDFKPHWLHWKEFTFWRANFHPPASLKTAEERDQFRSTLQAAVGAPSHALDPGGLGDAIGPLLAAELRESLLGCTLIIALVTLLSVGRWRAGWIAMLPVLCGLGVVLGAFNLFEWVLHPGNLLALPLLIGLGIDDGLHMVNRSLEGNSDPIQTTGVDVWRTTVTTAIGFGSLITAQSPAIASLGAVVLIGTLTCFLTTVVLLPWLLRSRSYA